ncbi:MAG: tetratricopeptide repeat protein [Promethearchaeota archaeon]
MPDFKNWFKKINLPITYDSTVEEVIETNSQQIDFKVFDEFFLRDEGITINNFFKLLIEEILKSSPDALALFKDISVINPELLTNINRKCVIASYDVVDTETAFDELVNTKLLKKKAESESEYEYFIDRIQLDYAIIAEKKSHEKALKYYEIKKKVLGEDRNDQVEVLFHKAVINPNEELVSEFIQIMGKLSIMDYGYGNLVNVGKLLLTLDDKYSAPIQVRMGNIYSDLGYFREGEKQYKDALEAYNRLAKKYYKIYLPYIAATQKALGKLYVDLKRFEEAEKVFLEILEVYKELEEKFYDVHSTDIDPEGEVPEADFHSKAIELEDFEDPESLCLDALNAYNEVAQKYYDVYLPDVTRTQSYFGNIWFDPKLLEETGKKSPESLNYPKLLAKLSYDSHLADIATTQNNLALVYREMGRFAEAEKRHLEALRIRKKLFEQYMQKESPNLALTMIDLGDLYVLSFRYDEAEPLYRDALQIAKNLALQNPEMYLVPVANLQNKIGNLNVNTQDYEEAEPMYLDALEVYRKLAKRYPKIYLAHVAIIQNNLGNLYIHSRELDKAQEYLNAALKSDPNNDDVLYSHACLESLKNNKEKALEFLSKAIEVNKKVAEWALMDNYFENIKDLKEFKELTGQEIKTT